MDISHKHFAPELDLAMSAWRALADVNKFSGGAKAVIEKWINTNPDAWQGKEDLSKSAKERIIILVNWTKGGP